MSETNETEGQPIVAAPVLNAATGAPASEHLDVTDGGSTWDAKSFVPPNLDDMPKEGPGSPGYDVYAPENAKWEHPELFTSDDEADDEYPWGPGELETAEGDA